MENNKKITKKTWEEFRDTGLLLIINQFLHIFGWAIVFEFDYINKELKLNNVYPARVKFRGYGIKHVEENYIKVSEYMSLNAEELLKEVKEG